MQVVECASGFESDVTLTKPPGDGEREPTEADAKSVLGVITLACTQGTALDLRATGPDAQAAADAIAALFADGFGEAG